MEVERSPSPSPSPSHIPSRDIFASFYNDDSDLEQSFLRRNTWYEKKRSRNVAHITQEDDDSSSDSCATHSQDCKRFKGYHRGRTPTRGRPITPENLPFNPHNTPVKKTQEMEEVELHCFNRGENEEKIDEITSSHTFQEENSMRVVDADMLANSTELIFNGPFEEIFSKLADCFVLQRERFLTLFNNNTSCVSHHKEGPGLIFSFFEGNSDSDDNLTCSASFQTEFKAENVFTKSNWYEFGAHGDHTTEYSRLVYFHKEDHGTLFNLNVQVGVPITLSNSLVLLKPPVGFCFDGENVLIMANQQMLRTLFNFHMQKEYGKPFLDIISTPQQQQGSLSPFATSDTSTVAIHQALEDHNTFTLITDVDVGSCILFLCTTFTKSFINQELLGDFDNMALLDFHASAHVRRLAYHRGIKCLDCDVLTQKIVFPSGQGQSQWQACLNSGRKADIVHHLMQTFSREDCLSSDSLPFYDEEEDVTLEMLSNAILFQHQRQQQQQSRRHVSTTRERSIDFHDKSTKEGQQGYCFLMSNPLLNPYNGALDTVNISKHTCINNLLLQLSENNRTNYNNRSAAAQNHTYSSKSGDLLGFFRL